jgi:DNA-binding NarL/FixJ family response regulator
VLPPVLRPDQPDQGMINREIANVLTLSVGTVKWYVSQIMNKLNVQNRVQAIEQARKFSLIS